MTTDELKALLKECRLLILSNLCHYYDFNGERAVNKLDAAIASDFAVVPKEPTEAMVQAMSESTNIDDAYKAMIEASEGK